MARCKIPYRVEHKDVIGGFETIAAFDILPAAAKYARDCAKNCIPGAQYRVTYRGKILRNYPL